MPHILHIAQLGFLIYNKNQKKKHFITQCDDSEYSITSTFGRSIEERQMKRQKRKQTKPQTTCDDDEYSTLKCLSKLSRKARINIKKRQTDRQADMEAVGSKHLSRCAERSKQWTVYTGSKAPTTLLQPPPMNDILLLKQQQWHLTQWGQRECMLLRKDSETGYQQCDKVAKGIVCLEETSGGQWWRQASAYIWSWRIQCRVEVIAEHVGAVQYSGNHLKAI